VAVAESAPQADMRSIYVIRTTVSTTFQLSRSITLVSLGDN